MVEPTAISSLEERVASARDFVRPRIRHTPHIALVLGSGLGEFADQLSETTVIPTSEIPQYPKSTVPGHHGKLVIGSIVEGKEKSRTVLVFKGRVHFYETGDPSTVVFPIHLARELGCEILLVTNAAGGINRSFSAGQLMLLRDVINFAFLDTNSCTPSTNVRSKPMTPRLTARSSKSQSPFDRELQNLIRSVAIEENIPLAEGTYCWLKGPSYETAAEIEMLHRIGVDAVGMSTVPEIVAGRSLGMRVAGISLISNLGTGITGQKLSHEEVTETAENVKVSFAALMKEVILRI